METEQQEIPVKVRKKPGPKPRNVSSAPANEQIASKRDAGQSREDAAHIPDRPKRIPMGAMSKLDIPFPVDKINFYHYYFIENNVHQAQQAYYEVVQAPTGVAHKVQYKGETLVLMRLPMQYHQEDLLAKRKGVINTLKDEKTGGVDRKSGLAPEYSGLEGRKSAIDIQDSGFDPDNESPYSS